MYEVIMNEPPNGIIRRVYVFLIPPPQWRLPVIIMLGSLTGLGIMVFYISNAVSYLSDDPAACVNCHVMVPQHATWQRGSHGIVAACNDCHVPHNNPISTYVFKASDGVRHAFMFTFRLEPQVIRMHEPGMATVQENCVRCHHHTVSMTDIQFISASDIGHGRGKFCWDCHRETPHGRISSLSSTPYARVPVLGPVTPAWMRDSTMNVHTSQQELELQ